MIYNDYNGNIAIWIIHTYMHACRQTDRQTNRQTNRQTARRTTSLPTYLHTYIPTYLHTYIYIYTAILPLVISGGLRFHAISLHSEVLCTITHFSRHPVVRYLNGLNRPLFLPFIPMLEAFTNVARLSKKKYWVSSLLGPFFFFKAQVHDIGAEVDYRILEMP